MGEFAKQVRNDSISGPLRRKFTSEGWTKKFQMFSDPDDEDRNLFSAALGIHKKLENIRARLQLSTLQSLSATTKLRAFVATANHQYLVAKGKSEAAIAEIGARKTIEQPEGFRLEELANVKLELSDGFKWSAAEIVESSVDAIEIPVRFALSSSPSLAGNPKMAEVAWLDIVLELNLGVMYKYTEDLWDDCLWNNYRLLDGGRTKLFVPKETDPLKGFYMGLARRTSLNIAMTAVSIKYQRRLVEERRLPRISEIRAIERQGKRQLISVCDPDRPSKYQEQFIVNCVIASEPYYAELLGEPQSMLGGRSVGDLLKAWGGVSRASSLLAEQVSKKHDTSHAEDSNTGSWLPEYAPVLQVDALVKAISSIAAVSRAESIKLIEFLTFKGLAGQEIWAQPLIPVGPTTLAPTFIAAQAPNLRRLVDVWLRQLGVDLSRRGPVFEMHLRDTVRQGIINSKFLSKSAWSIKDDYTFRPVDAREEQIDLILVIGSTVIVAEAKCILEPTESKGIAMHRRTIVGAADQVKRKCQAIESHRTEFIADVTKFGINLQPSFKVIPLVIVSTTTHVGVPAEGVAVVDEYIVARFLDGELEDVGMSGEELAIVKRNKTRLYSDASEAEVRVLDYFYDPPQMKRFKAGVHGRTVPLYAIDGNDWEGLVMTMDCSPKEIVERKEGVVEAT